MSLVVDISVNRAKYTHVITARRVEGDTHPDSIGTYAIRENRMDRDGPMSEVGHGELTHRYGDGALVLAHAALGRVLERQQP